MKNFLPRSTFTSLRHLATKNVTSPDANPKLPKAEIFINNKWVDSLKPGNRLNVFNPTTGKIITTIPDSSKDDVDRAVEAARKAFHPDSPWRKLDGLARSKLLVKLSRLVERDAAYLASLDTLEVGKLYSMTLAAELPVAYNNFFVFGSQAEMLYAESIPVKDDTICYTVHEPVGVCALLCAWNFAVPFVSTKLAPCLVSGNVAILKPSSNSTLASAHMVELAKEAGIPEGVISFLPGTKHVGQMLSGHPGVDLISITGSTQAGADVAQVAGKTIKRTILELGSKSPLVVCEDVDVKVAAKSALKAAFLAGGQCCSAASRTYVHESIYNEFLEHLMELTRNMKIGDPFLPDTAHGPQASEAHLNSILNMIEIGKKEGAELVVGGKRCARDGYFLEPAIFTNIQPNMTIYKEEIFGPVQTVIPFKTLDEAIDRANNSRYGLTSGIFTKDINKIVRFTKRIQTGTVWANCYFKIRSSVPFGGYKESGYGKEGGLDSIYSYTQKKCVQIRNKLST